MLSAKWKKFIDYGNWFGNVLHLAPEKGPGVRAREGRLGHFPLPAFRPFSLSLYKLLLFILYIGTYILSAYLVGKGQRRKKKYLKLLVVYFVERLSFCRKGMGKRYHSMIQSMDVRNVLQETIKT